MILKINFIYFTAETVLCFKYVSGHSGNVLATSPFVTVTLTSDGDQVFFSYKLFSQFRPIFTFYYTSICVLVWEKCAVALSPTLVLRSIKTSWVGQKSQVGHGISPD